MNYYINSVRVIIHLHSEGLAGLLTVVCLVCALILPQLYCNLDCVPFVRLAMLCLSFLIPERDGHNNQSETAKPGR